MLLTVFITPSAAEPTEDMARLTRVYRYHHPAPDFGVAFFKPTSTRRDSDTNITTTDAFSPALPIVFLCSQIFARILLSTFASDLVFHPGSARSRLVSVCGSRHSSCWPGPLSVHKANQLSPHPGIDSVRVEQSRPRFRPFTLLRGAALAGGNDRDKGPFPFSVSWKHRAPSPSRRGNLVVESQPTFGSCLDDSLLPLVLVLAGARTSLQIARSYRERSEGDLSHVHLLTLG